MCLIRMGDWVEGIINVLTLGHGKSLAGWVALNLFRKEDCGCERRRIFLNELFGCKEGIKL